MTCRCPDCVQYAHMTFGSISAQLPGCSPAFRLRMHIMDLFVASTCSFVLGWYTLAKLNLILLSKKNYFISLLVNCVPLSVIIYGVLNLYIVYDV